MAMIDDNIYLMLDFETRSEAELENVGAYEYARHVSTQVLCAAWTVGTREELGQKGAKAVTVWNTKLYPKDSRGLELQKLLNNPKIKVVAHNAGFEQVIVEFVLPKHLPGIHHVALERWYCTAALAATHALPRSLDGATSALGLKHKKDLEGAKLIKQHCVPQRLTINRTYYWDDRPEGLERLAHYCAQDIRAHTGVFLALPPLTPTERKVWLLNQKINRRGVYIDRDLAKTANRLIDIEKEVLKKEALEITNGIEPTQNAKIKKWCAQQGSALPNMQKKTIDDAIAAGLVKGPVKRLLEIRQSASKTSTGKYQSFLVRTHFDSRLRDFIMYHGASTGRDTARGPQVHNQPRGNLGELYDVAIKVINDGSLEWVRALLGDPMSAFSSVLRGVIRSTPGKVLYSGDFNAIEARVVFWLAGHEKGLNLFSGKRDPYREMAAKIFGVPLEKVTDAQREVGKRVILGCGYGMGDVKFEATCKQFGTPISTDLAKRSVRIYRTTHHPVPQLWKNLEYAAIEATKNKGKRYTTNRTAWFVRNEFLYCELPSGRKLAYHWPTIKSETKWDYPREVLYHWGEHPKTKQWVDGGTYGGRLCENVTQAVARDIMVEAQLRSEEKGFDALFSVHDELVNESVDENRIEEFESSMAQVPVWAKGLPIKVKVWSEERYRK